MALGVWGQTRGQTFAPVAYLSKQLNATVGGQQLGFRALAEAFLLAQKASKLTVGQPLSVLSPHGLKDLLSYRSLSILPSSKLQLSHISLLGNPNISFGS